MMKLKFDELNLSKELLKAVHDMGFEEASPIQSQAIPMLLEGNDVLGQSQTGTGKTAAFGLPILEKITTEKYVQALIMCPTRELAIQVSEQFIALGKYKKSLFVLPIYGGQSIDRQIRGLEKGVQVVIGTPGRIIDHIDRGTLRLDKVKMVVLDEADEMLDMGFRDDIEKILQQTPSERQTIFFSATMPKPILDLTRKYQRNPQMVKIAHESVTVPLIEQSYYEVREPHKLEVLSRLLDLHNIKLGLVFCNTKKKVDEVVSHLQARGYSAEGLHGDLSQAQRDQVMNKFRKGTLEILVATDVAARGIDVDDVEAVFNYDVPQDEESYVHRIGRTGRAGRSGRAFTFASGREFYKLQDIQRYAKAKITRGQIPSYSDVEQSRVQILLNKAKEIVNEGGLEKFVRQIEHLMNEDFSPVEIAAAFMKMEIGERDENTPDEIFQGRDDRRDDRRDGGRDGGRDRGGRGGDRFDRGRDRRNMIRLVINVGAEHNVAHRDVLGAIAGESGISGRQIGEIKIHERHSFVDVPKESADQILRSMKRAKIKGKKVTLELADPNEGRR